MTLPITTGIELELWVTDPDGAMADCGPITDAHARIEPEFVPSLFEVKTEPHNTEAGLREDLHGLLRTATETAAANDLRLVPFGTPLTETNGPATSKRGQLFEDIYGDGILAAKNCAGSHIHFEKSNVRRQLNLLTALDPALALVSSSPYYRGERSLDCSRAGAYRETCGRDVRQFCELLEYADSVDAWEERLDRMYEGFCSIAGERGVSRAAVREHFCATDTALNPVRLQQSQPTVEWRAPDSTLPSQIVSLAVDVGSLVAQTASKPLEIGRAGMMDDSNGITDDRNGITDDRNGITDDRIGVTDDRIGVTDDRIGIPDFGTVRRLSRLAIRSGCHEPPVSEYLERMGFDVGKYDPLSPHLDGPAKLSEATARRARITQSERLERDLQTLTDRSATDAIECPKAWAGWAQPRRPEVTPQQ